MGEEGTGRDVSGQVLVWVVLAILIVALVVVVVRRSRSTGATSAVGGAGSPAAGAAGAVGVAGVAAAAAPTSQEEAPHADEPRTDPGGVPQVGSAAERAAPVEPAGDDGAVPGDAAGGPAAGGPPEGGSAVEMGAGTTNGPDTAAAPSAAGDSGPTAEPAPEPAATRAPADRALAALDSSMIGAAGAAAVAGAALAAVVTTPGPHEGSVLPTADGSPPSEAFAVKANEGSRRYHSPESPFYVRTRADLWFSSAAAAEAAGFTAWNGSRAT